MGKKKSESQPEAAEQLDTCPSCGRQRPSYRWIRPDGEVYLEACHDCWTVYFLHETLRPEDTLDWSFITSKLGHLRRKGCPIYLPEGDCGSCSKPWSHNFLNPKCQKCGKFGLHAIELVEGTALNVFKKASSTWNDWRQEFVDALYERLLSAGFRSELELRKKLFDEIHAERTKSTEV